MIKLQQYNVFKLNTSRIAESNYNVTLTIPQARLNGELVQIGDNQVFRMIRNMRDIELNENILKSLLKERNKIKKEVSIEENKNKLIHKQKEIDDILFVPDIVNVKVDDKKVYKYICKNGFVVNGIKYLRFSSGAGQSRRNIASFANVEIRDELIKKLDCGLKIKKINVAKYNAYFGLYMSATYPVRTPRVCLIDDCEEFKLPKVVDWIEDGETTDFQGKKVLKRTISEKEFDFIPNMWDGQGLISPTFAKKWKEDLKLDYLPSQFGLRSSFIKGMLVNFDFHEFAKNVAKKDKIVDHYGDEWDIEDIDVLLSVSQFKMYKYYNSWQEFIDLQEHHGHTWGVTKVNPKQDNEMSLLNYQYIQTLSLDRDKVIELASYTTNWIDKVCNGDKLSTLLFMLGEGKETDTLTKLFSKTNNDYAKAVLYNDELLQDPYIKKKIYDGISTKIQNAKIGRLWVNGNYQAMISDPYGQAQWAFGMGVTGLLNEFEHCSNFWNKRNVKKVDACRSPMVDFHEHNILNFIQNEKTQDWYKYIHSGIIYNVWGVDTIRHSDSDWDYDIVFTTDNEIMLNNIVPDQNVITYDKTSAPSQSLNNTTLMQTDLRSFNSKVGNITNYSTSFITMLANFKKDSDEYNELLHRIKLLRRYIGDSIDQAKGIKMKPFPSEWKKRKYIKKEYSPEVKQLLNFANKLAATRKPYFMIYIYDKLRIDYREHRKNCDRSSKEKFGLPLGKLLQKKDKSKEESAFVAKYFREMPVLKNHSVMNMLCNHIEGVDFKYKQNNNDVDNDKYYDILSDNTIEIDSTTLEKLQMLYKKFKSKKNFKLRSNILDSISYESTDDENELDNKLDEFYEEMRNEAYQICSNAKELANHLLYIVYILRPKESKEFAWNIGIEGILENLKDKSNMEVKIPMLDHNGEDYLGKKYSLRSVIV